VLTRPNLEPHQDYVRSERGKRHDADCHADKQAQAIGQRKDDGIFVQLSA